MRITVFKSFYRLAAAAALLSIAMVAAFSHVTHATAANPKTFVSADNTFYTYVKGGETLSVAFVKSSQVELTGLAQHDVTVGLEGPGLPLQTCVIPKSVAVGKGCGFTNIVAPQSGVYKTSFKLPEAAMPYEEVSPTVKWGGNLFSWSLVVKDGETEKSGRTWSELYAVRQPIPESFLTDLTYHYVSESGHVYRAGYKGYNGQISTFSADAVGIRKDKQCVSAYRSIEVANTEYSPSFGTCGGSYKLFFEQPAGDLPQKALTWDGKTSEWVMPADVPPKVTELKFVSDKTGDAQSGKVQFKLDNFVGQYTVDIDVSGDGMFGSKDDVILKRTMKKVDNGLQEVVFSGVDAKGQVVPASQPISIRINVEKTAEIHLVNADVEGRTGGLELVRLSGENAPGSRMCWNDTDLATFADTSLQTKLRDGRDCPDSTTVRHHGWPYTTGSWGDNRYIDDWAYASARVEGKAMIRYPEETESIVAGTTDAQTRQLAVVVAAGALLALFGGLIIAVIVRRRRHMHMVRKVTEQHLPTDFPGPGDPQPPLR